MTKLFLIAPCLVLSMLNTYASCPAKKRPDGQVLISLLNKDNSEAGAKAAQAQIAAAQAALAQEKDEAAEKAWQNSWKNRLKRALGGTVPSLKETRQKDLPDLR